MVHVECRFAHSTDLSVFYMDFFVFLNATGRFCYQEDSTDFYKIGLYFFIFLQTIFSPSLTPRSVAISPVTPHIATDYAPTG